MKKPVVIGVVAAVAILLIGGGLLLANNNSEDGTTSSSDMSSMDMNTTPSNDTSTSDSSSSSEATMTDVVAIENRAYSPANITVKKGTTVTWTNKDDTQHDVMTDTEGRGPSSELLSKGETYSYTFDEVGTFSYHCTPHPDMQATVTVTE